MATNGKQDGDYEDDADLIEDEIELDPFLDQMQAQDNSRSKAKSPRRKIEALQEKRRLKELLEDYPDYD